MSLSCHFLINPRQHNPPTPRQAKAKEKKVFGSIFTAPAANSAAKGAAPAPAVKQ